MSDPITVRSIGVVSGCRSQIFEDHWGTVVSRLILDPAAADKLKASPLFTRTVRPPP